MPAKPSSQPCPCGGGPYAACCGPFHAGAAAPTAEKLMRSRYSAYVLGDAAYLRRSWHSSTRPSLSELTAEPGVKWLGLEVRKHEAVGDEARVEFIARYRIGGRAHRLHEISRFRREEGQWYYVDGEFPAS